MYILIFCAIAFTSAAPQNDANLSVKVQKPALYSLHEAPVLFEDFIKKHNKKYDVKEKEERFKIFVDNVKKINSLNENSSNAVFSINKFSDLSQEEFKKFYTGLKLENSLWNGDYKRADLPVSLNVTAPESFDWRSKGVVSRVKNQQQCGSCWAFSTTGNVESVNAIKTGNLVEVSEQQLVDCDTSDGACGGGYPFQAINYLISNGAMSEESYPYAGSAQNCNYDSSKVVVRPSNLIQENVQEDQLMDKLYSTAPLSILIASDAITQYSGGILVDQCSGQSKIDHAVLLVGYGTEGGTDYWIVKNSWDADWGEQGYFRMKRGVNCLRVVESGIVSAVI